MTNTFHISGEVSGEVTEEIKRVVLVLNGEDKRIDIQTKLELKSDDYFRLNYITLEFGFISINENCV